MRFLGKIKQYNSEVQGTSNDGREWKRRDLVIDAGYTNERGEEVEQSFAGSTCSLMSSWRSGLRRRSSWRCISLSEQGSLTEGITKT